MTFPDTSHPDLMYTHFLLHPFFSPQLLQFVFFTKRLHIFPLSTHSDSKLKRALASKGAGPADEEGTSHPKSWVWSFLLVPLDCRDLDVA